MAEVPDLSLPAKAPEIAQYHNNSMALLPFALYDLVGLSDEEYTHVVDVCNSEYGNHGNSVRRPPRSGFGGKPLHEVFEYHLSLITQRTFEAFHFLVVTSKEWKTDGILIVALDDENMGCNVDKCFLKAEETGLALVNVQIGNTDWPDVKDQAIGTEE